MTTKKITTQVTAPAVQKEIFHVRFRNGKELFLSGIPETAEKQGTYRGLVRGFHTYVPPSKQKKLLHSHMDFEIAKVSWVKKLKVIGPRSIVKLVKLWPHARKQGHEIGELRTVGYYSKQDGLDVIWLVDAAGKYNETSDHDFLARKYEIVFDSCSVDFYGDYVPEPLLRKVEVLIAELKLQGWNMLSALPTHTTEIVEIEAMRYKFLTRIERISKTRIGVSVGVDHCCLISSASIAANGFVIDKAGKTSSLPARLR